MSSLTQGLSGLVLGYAAVAIPMAVTLLRRAADYGKVLASAAISVPLTAVAGMACAAVGPLIHGLGVSSGSFLEFAVGVGVCAGIGYAAARGLARSAPPASVHRRGTLIRDTHEGSPARSRPRSREGVASPEYSNDRTTGQAGYMYYAKARWAIEPHTMFRRRLEFK